MSRINILCLCFLIAPSFFAQADDVGNNPGYISTPASGDNNIIKTGYGECVHNGYWQGSYRQDQCNQDYDKIVKQKITFSESSVHLFNFNSTTLSEDGKRQLMSLLNQLRDSGDIQWIEIAGYADMIGGDDYNLRLSDERATAIADFMVEQGVDSDLITSEGYGSKNSQVSKGCFKKYGTSDLVRINRLTANDKNSTPSQRSSMDQSLAQFAVSHSDLVSCTSADRRVEITVNEVKEVPVSQ